MKRAAILPASLALAALAWPGCHQQTSDEAEIVALDRAILRESRLTAARFAGARWAPWPTPPRVRPERLRAWSRQLEGATGNAPEALSAKAGLALSAGNVEAAVRLFQVALIERETSDRATDLAAALYERARRGGGPGDLLSALDRLGATDPADPAALHNRALILEALALTETGRRAWLRAVDGERDGFWRTEALERSRQARGARPFPCSEARKSSFSSVHPNVPDSDLEHFVEECSAEAQEAGLYAMLADWGEDPEGADAPLLLDRARRIGAALAKRGDSTLAASVERIESATAESLATLAAGHAALGRGRRSFLALEIESSIPHLRQAAGELERARSPAAPWARYWLAATNVYGGRFDALRAALDRLAATATARRDSRLGAWMELSRGSAALREDRLELALGHYRSAISRFEAVGDDERVGAAQTALGDTLEKLGRTDDEWRARAVAQDRLADRLDSGWRATNLYSWALSALHAGLTDASRALAEENLSSLGPLSNRVDRIEAELLLGRIAHRAGDREDARRAFVRAADGISELEDGLVRRSLTSDLELARAEAGDYEDAGAAVAGLTRGLAAQDSAGRRHDRAALLLELGRARLRRGETAAALDELERAAAEHERALADLVDPLLATPLAEVGQRIYDELIAVRSRRGDLAGALATAERARALPADRRSAGAGRAALDRVRAALEPGELLLAFTESSGRIYLAQLERDGEELSSLEATATEVDLRARRWLARLAARADDQEIQEDALWLSRALLSVATARISRARRLLVTPDGALALIPFGALALPDADRPLLAALPVSVVPSGLALARQREARRGRRDDAAWRVAVLGTSAARVALDGAPELAGAAAEATAVAALWPGARTAVGAAATPAAWTEALSTSTLVHFAGHARAEPGAPGRAALWLWDEAAGGERPFAVAGLGHGPWPELELVVLSGCETALPAPRRYIANDGVAALFLAHGVPAVVATLWPIEDRASARLFTTFHRELAGGAATDEALRRAQLDLFESPDFQLRNPAFWAAAQLVGAPHRRPPT